MEDFQLRNFATLMEMARRFPVGEGDIYGTVKHDKNGREHVVLSPNAKARQDFMEAHILNPPRSKP